MRNRIAILAITAASGILFAGKSDNHPVNSGSNNLHLEDTVRFHAVKPGADVDRGRVLFGVGPDLNTEDTAGALFEGASMVAGQNIVSNGRTCFTCHRGLDQQFGLPVPNPNLSTHVPLTDTLFEGMDADAQGDPDAPGNLESHALIKYRPNRFNPTRGQDDPFRQVFFWRKSTKLLNVGLSQTFLNDGRGRVMFETARGAVFSHTQPGDERFDDLFLGGVGPDPLQKGHDIEAFLFTLFTDPRLAALRDSTDPLYDDLVGDPFYTVEATTDQELLGQDIFRRDCLVCHSTPNVFNNLSNVEPLGNGERPDNVVPWAPSTGRNFNVGVAEANSHGLRFTRFMGMDGATPVYEPIVVPLAREDGSIEMHTVESDIGLAATTGRAEDVGRFKVPQLRDLVHMAPYFHNNSATTIEEVVDYFNSDAYNNSKDGQLYPIHQKPKERAALIAFLKAL